MPQHEPTLEDELEERYAIVREKIGMGLEQRHFVNWAVDNTDWNISKRQLRNYYKTVQERMQTEVTEQSGRSTIDDYVRHMERLDYLYRDSVSKGDNKTALAVAKEYADFRDLKNPESQIDWRKVANELGLSTDAEQLFDRIERLKQAEQGRQNATNNG